MYYCGEHSICSRAKQCVWLARAARTRQTFHMRPPHLPAPLGPKVVATVSCRCRRCIRSPSREALDFASSWCGHAPHETSGPNSGRRIGHPQPPREMGNTQSVRGSHSENLCAVQRQWGCCHCCFAPAAALLLQVLTRCCTSARANSRAPLESTASRS